MLTSQPLAYLPAIPKHTHNMARASRPRLAAAPFGWRAAARLVLAVVLLFPAPAACQAAAPRDYTATSTRGARTSSSNRARADPAAAAAAAAARDTTSSAGIGGRMRVMEGAAVPDATRVDSPSGRASASYVQYISAYLFMRSPLPIVPPTPSTGKHRRRGSLDEPPWHRHIVQQTGALGGDQTGDRSGCPGWAA